MPSVVICPTAIMRVTLSVNCASMPADLNLLVFILSGGNTNSYNPKLANTHGKGRNKLAI